MSVLGDIYSASLLVYSTNHHTSRDSFSPTLMYYLLMYLINWTFLSGSNWDCCSSISFCRCFIWCLHRREAFMCWMTYSGWIMLEASCQDLRDWSHIHFDFCDQIRFKLKIRTGEALCWFRFDDWLCLLFYLYIIVQGLLFSWSDDLWFLHSSQPLAGISPASDPQ